MSKLKYTAKVFLGDDEFAHQDGDDIEHLNEWMLIQAQGKFGDVHGEIIENHTQKVVRRFRRAPPD